jgi:formylglycine-generating enzyme required for sulfatase activity
MYSGSNNIASVAWYYDNSSGSTHPVKCKAPNELGIYDMSGNVYEKCADWYEKYSSSPQINPKGPSSGLNRIFRGGCYRDYASKEWHWDCRVYNREYGATHSASEAIGLRLAQ